jgi:hypothetical protein
MTASNDKEGEVSDSGLPSAFEFLLYSFTLTKRYAADVYGFAAYLLFPMILYVGVRGMTGLVGEIAISVVNVLFILISCWATAAIVTLTSMRALHPKKDPDPRSVGMYAVSVLSTLTFTLVLSTLIQAAGYLLIVPGVIATVLFTFAVQEVVLRGHGPLSALAASRARVQPQFFAIAWRLLALGVTALIVYLAVVIGALLLASFALGVGLLDLANSTPLWLDALISLLQIAFLPPLVIAHTVLYLASDSAPAADVEKSKE